MYSLLSSTNRRLGKGSEKMDANFVGSIHHSISLCHLHKPLKSVSTSYFCLQFDLQFLLRTWQPCVEGAFFYKDALEHSLTKPPEFSIGIVYNLSENMLSHPQYVLGM
jgi:hypothetical protein